MSLCTWLWCLRRLPCWLLFMATTASATTGPSVISPSVISLNLCADQLVMLLADREQIVGLSPLARDVSGSYFYQRAQSLPLGNGSSEQALSLNPDVIIAGTYTTRYTVRMLQQRGMRVEILPIANSVEQMLDNLRLIGDWLQQPEKADREIRHFRQRLSQLSPVDGERPVAAVYDPNGYTAGVETLRGDMLTLAGWDNLATARGINQSGSLPLETLVLADPDAVFQTPYSVGTWSRAQRLSQHPVLGLSGIDPLRLTAPGRATICAGPWIMDVIEALHAARVDLQAAAQ